MHDRLQAIVDHLSERRLQLESKKDLRAVFTYAYERITLAIDAHFETAGFLDREWMLDLCERFAGAYLVVFTIFLPLWRSGRGSRLVFV